MSPTAAAELISLSGGYPYAIQVAGHYAWRESTGRRQIDVTAARAARPRIERDLQQLHRGRWDDASARERDYLLALARATAAGNATGRGVANEMSLTTQQVAYLRDRLMKKGTIYAEADGSIHFITPGMAEWALSEHA